MFQAWKQWKALNSEVFEGGLFTIAFENFKLLIGKDTCDKIYFMVNLNCYIKHHTGYRHRTLQRTSIPTTLAVKDGTHVYHSCET